MNRPVLIIVLAALAAVSLDAAIADAPKPLARLEWLRGHWVGTGDGEPGHSATERHVACALDCRYLRIDGRSVYPRQEKNKKGEIHRSIDMWSFDKARKRLVLRTFDNLGFVTTYVEDAAQTSDTTLVLSAEQIENVPSGWRARYTYTFVPPDEYRELFELDASGKGFETYVSNRFLRVEDAKAPIEETR